MLSVIVRVNLLLLINITWCIVLSVVCVRQTMSGIHPGTFTDAMMNTRTKVLLSPDV